MTTVGDCLIFHIDNRSACVHGGAPYHVAGPVHAENLDARGVRWNQRMRSPEKRTAAVSIRGAHRPSIVVRRAHVMSQIPRLPLHLRYSAVAVFVIAVGSLLSFGCHNDTGPGPSCQGGQYCACGGGPECFLECNTDSCNLECSNTANSCGAICADHCTASCHDTNDCSAYCGDACTLSCHNATSCAAQCGAGCIYSCHDTTRCGVIVGPNSSVSCDHVPTCAIECAGACSVTCTNYNTCTVTCAPGHVQTDNGNGNITCS
jgi:hypothetical protein